MQEEVARTVLGLPGTLAPAGAPLELAAHDPLLNSILGVDQIILDALPMGFYACDGQGRILRVNKRAAELWGRSPRLHDSTQRFCGSFRVESLEGDYIPPDQTPMSIAVRTGASFEAADAVVQNPDGKRWIARVHVAPLRAADGTVIGAINCFRDVTREHETRLTLARHQRNFDHAMVASKMGTWRYTFADNICVYDENAQRLYGLTEARFVHDEAGVQDKFHPADVARMWDCVAGALQPGGNGQYEVEYRVRQLDGSWRWLSAWGLVEFEGRGDARKPVAIAGASRDLTELKRAEELQDVLINELNHRVKNTLATVQSMVVQTLRRAGDLESASSAISSRIVSLAGAHDLLTSRSWESADVTDVVSRVIAPFGVGQFKVSGSSVELPPKQVLALSLGLHELATNAAKYGGLSSHEGRVEIRWHAKDGLLHLTWREIGGPLVAPPERRGLGSRLLQEGLFNDF
jgi:two-component sensor histidine kinase/PAS domain-containing protein